MIEQINFDRPNYIYPTDKLHATVQQAPEEFRTILLSFDQCATRPDSIRWKQTAIQQITDAISDEAKETNYFGEIRTNCPLCNRPSLGPFHEGFKLPEGLRRHLDGYRRQCQIMYAAEILARDHWDKKFKASEDRELAEAKATYTARRAEETLFQVAPNSEPLLIDESLGYDRHPRDPESLTWAENRLTEIGFIISIQNNVKSYTWQQDDWIVYADPRELGRIEFTAIQQIASQNDQADQPSTHQTYHHAAFYLLDTWRHKITDKFTKRINQVIKNSAPKTANPPPPSAH